MEALTPDDLRLWPIAVFVLWGSGGIPAALTG
jgi:hypothetical protein